MHNAMNAVLEFHEAVDQPIGDPRAPDVTVDQQLRVDLIAEEYQELVLALQGKDKHGNTLTREEQIVAVADALGDLSYVTCGAAVSWGIDLGAVFDAIHDSNMSKTAEGVKAINDLKLRCEKRPDGKVLKGPNYRPPDIAGALAAAKEEAEQGFGPDCFWPTPTVLKNLPPKKPAIECTCPHQDANEELHNASCEVSKAEARKHKPIDLAKIKADHKVPANMAWTLDYAKDGLGADEKTLKKIAEEISEEPPPVSKELKLAAAMKSIKADYIPDLKGYFTSYGCYVFDCTKCKRTHTANMKAGTRNGWASKCITECMCGMRYEIVFVERKGKDPTVQASAVDLGGTAPSGGA